MKIEHLDSRTPAEREADIRAHRRRIQSAFRRLREAGHDPHSIMAVDADKIFKKGY